MADPVYGPSGLGGMIGPSIADLNRLQQLGQTEYAKPSAKTEARARLEKLAKVIADHSSAEDCAAAADALRPFAAAAMEKL